MLIEFSVANFRSIRERVTLSMMATDEEGLERNVIQPHGLLNSAVIYGANASGKSNVLKAMEFMMEHVIASHFFQKGMHVDVASFRLDSEYEKKPSEFEILFVHEGIKYAYGFTIDFQKVHEEFLYQFSGEEQQLIFERNNTVDYEFGLDEQEQAVLAKRTLENVLYLSTATQFNFERIAHAFAWFDQAVECWVPIRINGLQKTMSSFRENEEVRELMKAFFRNADFGIEEIEVVEEDPIWLASPPEGYLLNELSPRGLAGARRGNTTRRAGSFKVEQFKIHRRVTSGTEEKRVTFSLGDESEGTQRLFQLIGPWLEVLKDGRLLIVDELENSLHPLIVEQLIKLFSDPVHNPNGAQLIFTTHNTNLLDNAFFRRDQIWFTEKDQSQGSTALYSLAEFTPRESEDIEKGYLLGRYGAIPFFGKEFLF